MLSIKYRKKTVETEYVKNSNEISIQTMAEKMSKKYKKTYVYYYNVFNGKPISEPQKNKLMQQIKSLK